MSDRSNQFVVTKYRRVILDRANLRIFKEENRNAQMELEFRLEFAGVKRLVRTVIRDDDGTPIVSDRNSLVGGISFKIGDENISSTVTHDGNVVRIEELSLDPNRYDADMSLSFWIVGRQAQFIRGTWQIAEIF